MTFTFYRVNWFNRLLIGVQSCCVVSRTKMVKVFIYGLMLISFYSPYKVTMYFFLDNIFRSKKILKEVLSGISHDLISSLKVWSIFSPKPISVSIFHSLFISIYLSQWLSYYKVSLLMYNESIASGDPRRRAVHEHCKVFKEL